MVLYENGSAFITMMLSSETEKRGGVLLCKVTTKKKESAVGIVQKRGHVPEVIE